MMDCVFNIKISNVIDSFSLVVAGGLPVLD